MRRVDGIAPNRVEDRARLADEARIVPITDALLFGKRARVSKPEAVPGLTMLAEGRGEVSTRAEALSRGMIEGF